MSALTPEIPEVDPSRRIIARTRGELQHPGSCAICGGSDPDRTFVDIGVYYDYEGNVYICHLCFDEAAVQVMGYFTREEHLKLLAHNNILIEQNQKLQAELDNYGELATTLKRLGFSSALPANILSDSSDLGTAETPEGTEAGESETPESVNGEGPEDSERLKLRNRSKPVIH